MENLNKKQFLTYDEPITFLEEKKGLIISDKEYARKTLLKIGYFPLINGYKEVFKESTNDQFQRGTTFEDIYELYSFDNDLRNVCAHNDRLFDFRTKDALLDRSIYERLQISKEKGRYKYGKNDFYAQVIILKLLLSDEDFRIFFHDLKVCFKKHPIHKEILERMGFPENWERIGRIKKYTKSEIY